MTLEEFKNIVIVMDDSQANTLRNKYIEKFINTNHPYYKEHIQHIQKFSDGYCYIGYLWDVLISSKVIEFDYFKNLVFINDVYIFWDIHTKDRIFIEDYWKFKKNDVLKLNYNILLDNLKYLPEDIYIFDETFDWTLILTHEDNHFNKRLYLKSGSL